MRRPRVYPHFAIIQKRVTKTGIALLLLPVLWLGLPLGAGGEAGSAEAGSAEAGSAEDGEHAARRSEMVETIRREVRDTSSYLGRSTLSREVLLALGTVPRHRFVPTKLSPHAYDNRPLAIGHGQTISQPYIVAIMTDLLELEPSDRVLEIGTGSGYQAAILGELVEAVHTMEIVPPLAERSSRLLAELGYENIETRLADGYHGWPEAAPFDAIIVTAAATHVPPPLVEQLASPGRMIIPVGSRIRVQQLVRESKDEKGGHTLDKILPVRFVPLTGGHD